MMGEYEAPPGPDLSKLVYGEEYDKLMEERTLMNKLKPALVFSFRFFLFCVIPF